MNIWGKDTEFVISLKSGTSLHLLEKLPNGVFKLPS